MKDAWAASLVRCAWPLESAPSSRSSSRRLFAEFALVGLAIVLLGSAACVPSPSETEPPDAWVTVRGNRVAVEIADTPEKQSLGLGERDSLAWGHGMLFPYPRPVFQAFWMKGMRFSIDIIWIREGRIVQLDANVPFKLGSNGPTLRSTSLIDAVLEVPAGYAMANGWRVGDRVITERQTAHP